MWKIYVFNIDASRYTHAWAKTTKWRFGGTNLPIKTVNAVYASIYLK